MERSICELLGQPDLSITDIAMKGGFSSSANYAKAFKLYFGLTPSQARDPLFRNSTANSGKIGKIVSKYGKVFHSHHLYSQFLNQSLIFEANYLEDMLMNVIVKSKPEMTLAYLTAPGGYNLNSIFETWDKIILWAELNLLKDHKNKRFAICHDNPMVTPEDKCRYDASIQINQNMEVIAPFSKTIMPAGDYGVAYYKGDGDKLSHFYMELYSNWLVNSGLEPDNYPPVAHYLNDSRQDGFVELEIWIKVKRLFVE